MAFLRDWCDDCYCINSFIRFVNIYPSVYSSMTDDYKMKIEQKINDKPNLQAMVFSFRVILWFMQ